ncbi:MAG: hypothetical protein HY518_00600 [Candidatus Aenigmarchaeota archaeon]|nr:hypothetical protein [Candidatus Aenigmarchaeota archaeon]
MADEINTDAKAAGRKGIDPKVKYAAAFIVIAIAAYVIAFNVLKPPEQESPLAGYEIYRGPGFVFLKPESWTARMLDSPASVAFYSPVGKDDYYQEYVRIDRENTTLNLSSFVIRDFYLMDRLIPTLDILPGPGPTTVNGNEAFRAGFTLLDSSNRTVRLGRVYIPKGNDVFVITYTALNETFLEYQTEVSIMLDSFTIASP